MRKFKGLTVFLLCAVMVFSSVACAYFGSNDSNTDTHQHKVIKRSGVEATCIEDGKLTYYECVSCKKLFADKACTTEIKASDIPLGKTSHQLTHVPEVEATKDKNGNIEYWECKVCGKFFADSAAENEISKDMVTTVNGIDFVVSVESGKEPVILQLADPQIIDSSTKRSDVSLSNDAIGYWNKDSRDELAYDLMTEVIEASNPDLILVSGDNVYGKYDDDGHLHEEFVAFMEEFKIPWAPIMGNHDIETAKGADWICDLYEGAPNCLFKQNTLSGHGNYTIGIEQGGEIKRVIFNMDTNGCTGASQASLDNPQTISYENNTYGVRYGVYGLQKDQISWFEKAADDIKNDYPNAKLSLHIHVPMNKVYTAINDAYKAKVGLDPVARMYHAFNNITANGRFLAPERVKGHTEGDFGMVYTLYPNTFIECWDTETTNGTGNQDQTYNRIKAKGIDSIFLGHMHSNSISIVYEGIRFQFGQKCTLFDSVQRIDSTGKMSDVAGAYALNSGETALVGGTVMKLDKDTGAIIDAYIEYNTGYGKEINWSKYYNTIG